VVGISLFTCICIYSVPIMEEVSRNIIALDGWSLLRFIITSSTMISSIDIFYFLLASKSIPGVMGDGFTSVGTRATDHVKYTCSPEFERFLLAFVIV